MSLLRRTRSELTGAWRSVRYDLGQRPVEPPSGGPDVTSTGMNTFGVPVFQDPPPPPPPRPRRRVVVVTGFGVLTVLGAAGAYLGVVTGLGSLTSQEAVAGTLPPRPAVTETFAPNAGIGRVPARGTRPLKPATPVPMATATDPTTGLPLPPRNVSPVRTSPKGINPTTPECGCNFPPVPTPTAPEPSPSASSSGAASDGPPADPSPSGSADPSETSATPDDSPEPSYTPHYRHRRRYH